MKSKEFVKNNKKGLITFDKIGDDNGIVEGNYTLNFSGMETRFQYSDVETRKDPSGQKFRGIIFSKYDDFTRKHSGQNSHEILFVLEEETLKWIDETEKVEQAKDGRIAAKEEESKYIRKEKEILYSDGDNILSERYVCDKKLLETKKGTIITESEMFRFLREKKIDRILVSEAVKMWADEKEEKRIEAEKKSRMRAQAIFEDDESDAGYAQACENAGVDRHGIPLHEKDDICHKD